MNIKCSNCQAQTIFAEDPYNTPGATKHWKSTYEPTDSMLVLQRKIPSINSKGKMTVRQVNEYVLEVYCGADCGLKKYDEHSRVE